MLGGFFPRPSPNAFGVDENPEGLSDPSDAEHPQDAKQNPERAD
ncbi:MAG: hypothetical protein QME51_04500 [Planctomycetota bacterium]|nr:hypothetical protein [Planctomycetota bacterium]MDI6787611.1 hypothetical protein [Planctomycetota bacterium]